MSLLTYAAFGLVAASSLHQISPLDDGWLQLGQHDPFLQFSVPEEKKLAQGVLLRYQLSNYPDKYSSEIFYSTDIHGFSSKHKYRFSLQGQKQNQIYIPLDLYDNEWLNGVRWDFDGCLDCKLKVTEVEYVDSASSMSPEKLMPYVPSGYKPLSFIKKNSLSAGARSYRIQDFHIHDFSHPGGNKLVVNGDSPFIVSPTLDLPLSDLAGVYYKLGLPGNQGRSIHFHLGWRTYKYGYRTRARIRVVHPESDVLEIFIPLSSISGEKVVRNFQTIFEPDMGDRWIFEEIRLVPISEMDLYQSLLPDVMINYPAKASAWVNILRFGLTRFMHDKPFVWLYFSFLFVFSLGLFSALWMSRKRR